ncbi:hypothetical protein [[Flexibacter] sp. ATCC 35208]|uniref:hypothetical protein n=1 Tax=[Flexibacter] sp. ATCC 35208 TaxID=1936242 RepID=UPI0009D6081B|nr:hypothetical protein [[Flexibacter] sp. ATCC 35208]OMP80096.1 hypothetical protein BW716_06280 [[Flexibacter] sp. ATCC 35208]
MERQDIFLLLIQGHNPSNKFHHCFSIAQAYTSFKQAFLHLQRFGNRYYDNSASLNLPMFISFAGIRILGDEQYLPEKKLIANDRNLQL